MIYTFAELEKKYNSRQEINKLLNEKKLFKISRGLYSDMEFPNEYDVITKKYPNAVFTMDSAFYYHNLTDVIPQKEFLATKRDVSKIKDNEIKQLFVTDNLFELGKTKKEVDGAVINIYDKERMLIELIRNRKSMPFDYYKEIINNYRFESNKLDVSKIEEYISKFPTEEHLFDIIRKEVF